MTALGLFVLGILYFPSSSVALHLLPINIISHQKFIFKKSTFLADCSKLDGCIDEFYENAGLKNPDGTKPGSPAEFRSAIAHLFDSQGRDGFKKLCSAGNNGLSACMGGPNPLGTCLTVGQLLAGGASIIDSIYYAQIYQELTYRCGVGYKSALRNWDCSRKVSKERASDIEQCHSLYRSQTDMNPAQSCLYSQWYGGCVSEIFKVCGQSAVLGQCQQIRATMSIALPNCIIQCTGDGVAPVAEPSASPKNTLASAYYSGSFVDLALTWQPEYSNPNAQISVDIIEKYKQQIALTLPLYDSVEATVMKLASFSTPTQNLTKIEFLVQFAVSDMNYPRASQVRNYIVGGANNEHFNWQQVSIVNLFEPLPTPLPQISYSSGWQRASKMLSDAIDEAANPCENFYQFACGNWIKEHPRPAYLSSIDVFTDLTLTVLNNISTILDHTQVSNSIHPIQQVKIYYDACLSGVTLGNDTQYIADLLPQYGNWPILDKDWLGPVGGASLGSASALIGRLLGTLKVATFMSTQSVADWRKPKQMVLLVYPAGPLVPASTPLDILTGNIVSIAKFIANAVGIPVDMPRFLQEATEIANVELELAKLPNPNIAFPYPYNIMTIESAQKRWNYFNWTQLFTWIAEGNIENSTMLEQKFLVLGWEYFDQQGSIFGNMSETVMQNFLLWRLVYLEVSNLPSFRQFRESFYKLKYRTVEAVPLSLHCANKVLEDIGWATGRVYVDEWLENTPTTTTGVLHDMITNVLGAFQGMLHNLEWIDQPSKAAAYEKVHNLVRNVAYPAFLLDDKQLDAMYAELQMAEGDDTFVKINKLLRFNTWTKLQQIGKPVDRTNMQMSPAVVNAWYAPQYNNINFPAAILNEPFFDANRPMAVNFGFIGAVMGHELTHGFDNNGVKWDGYGGYHPDGWMTNKSMAGFSKMSDCVVDEYSKFCFPQIGACVNGKLTEGENIADNGGLMAAYRAYESVQRLSGREPRLPGPMSKYSLEQVFFLTFGFNWCSNITDDALMDEVKNGGHSPDQARVMETLKNIPQFGKAFNCPTGSRMAPKTHCHVWLRICFCTAKWIDEVKLHSNDVICIQQYILSFINNYWSPCFSIVCNGCEY